MFRLDKHNTLILLGQRKIFNMLTIDGRGDRPAPKTTSANGINKSINAIASGAPIKALNPTTQRSDTMPGQRQHRHMWIVTGPAGCGKTTVAGFLASELGLKYIEGDDVSSILPLFSRL